MTLQKIINRTSPAALPPVSVQCMDVGCKSSNIIVDKVFVSAMKSTIELCCKREKFNR